MKRCLLLSLVCMFLFAAGCSGQTVDGPPEDGFYFVYHETEIYMHMACAPVIEALGDALSVYEAPSCAFQGNDFYYQYDSFELSAYEKDGAAYVYSVYLLDDTVSTSEGLSIGDSEEKVLSLYGEDGLIAPGAYLFIKGNSKIKVIIKNSVVSSIEYIAVV